MSTEPTSISLLLKDLEAEHARVGVSLGLLEPATHRELLKAEKTLHTSFAVDHRECLLHANGQAPTATATLLPGSGLMAPLAALLSYDATLRELTDELREEGDEIVSDNAYHHWPGRIPLGGHPNWDHQHSFIEGDGSLLLQIGDAELIVAAPSLKTALVSYLNAIRHRGWVFVGRLDCFMPKGEKHLLRGEAFAALTRSSRASKKR